MIVQFVFSRKVFAVNKKMCLTLMLFLVMLSYAARGEDYCGLIEGFNGPPEAYSIGKSNNKGDLKSLPDKPIYHRLTKEERTVCVKNKPTTKGKGAGENYMVLSLFGKEQKMLVNSTTGGTGCYQIAENVCSPKVWDKFLDVLANLLNKFGRTDENTTQVIAEAIKKRGKPTAQSDEDCEKKKKMKSILSFSADMSKFIPKMLKTKEVKLLKDRRTLYLFLGTEMPTCHLVTVTNSGNNKIWGEGATKEASVTLQGQPLTEGSYQIKIDNWTGNFKVVKETGVPKEPPLELPILTQQIYQVTWLASRGEEWMLEAYQRVTEILENKAKEEAEGYSYSAALVKIKLLEKGVRPSQQ